MHADRPGKMVALKSAASLQRIPEFLNKKVRQLAISVEHWNAGTVEQQ
jgi:hypothetical protein